MGLSIRDLCFGFKEEGVLLSLSLSVESGEFISVLGKSGCGKSTLLKVIAGLLRPESGEILLDGENIAALPPEKRGTVIVFQDLRLFPNMNVFENIAFPMKLRKLSREKIRERAEELLSLVELPGLGRRRIRELSGGQQQRVALARALAAKPRLLLLDEAFSGLDETLRREMGDFVRKLHEKKRITTLLITHQKDEALRLSDRIALMSGGRILQYDTPERIYHRPKSREAASFLGETNYFPGEIRSGSFFSSLGEIPLGSGEGEQDGPYELMLRPQEIGIREGGEYILLRKSYEGESWKLLLEKEGRKLRLSLSSSEYETFSRSRRREPGEGERFGIFRREGSGLPVLLPPETEGEPGEVFHGKEKAGAGF